MYNCRTSKENYKHFYYCGVFEISSCVAFDTKNVYIMNYRIVEISKQNSSGQNFLSRYSTKNKQINKSKTTSTVIMKKFTIYLVMKIHFQKFRI